MHFWVVLYFLVGEGEGSGKIRGADAGVVGVVEHVDEVLVVLVYEVVIHFIQFETVTI